MDHPDYFKDLDAVISSFSQYLSQTGELAIINADDANSLEAVKNFDKKVLTYAVESPADIRAKNIIYTDGLPEFDIYAHNAKYAHVKLSVPGDYNIYNALAAASTAYACDISGEAVSRGLNIFKGASRRFEYKGDLKNHKNIKVYEDYAHHPTELKKLLEAVKKIASGKIWCVFQPHTYSRTHELESELCEVLANSTANIILTEIYSATEVNTYNICSEDIARKIDCTFISGFEDIAEYLKSNCEPGDLILLTGAGNVNKITELLI
jgi:UDP-N-acetylmuramate--alanine ligase